MDFSFWSGNGYFVIKMSYFVVIFIVIKIKSLNLYAHHPLYGNPSIDLDFCLAIFSWNIFSFLSVHFVSFD